MNLKSILLAAAILMIGSVAFALHGRKPSPPALSATRALAADRIPYDPGRTASTIACFTTRVRRDPQSAIDYAILASTFLARCRETGDIGDALRAQNAARRSLAIRSRHNDAGYDALASAYITQHLFPQALALAARLVVRQPDDPQALAILIEAQAESGDEIDASRNLAALNQTGNGGPYALALWARINELNGRLPEARRLVEAAAIQADNSVDIPRENVAWFHFRVGNIRGEQGDAVGAEQAYFDALAWCPRDYRTMLWLAKLYAGEQRWTDATQWAERSAAIVPTPETVGLLVDCYQTTGNKAQAASCRSVMEAMRTLSRSQGIVYDRQLAIYWADHGLHLDEALALARHELTVRKDVYAYDTLGWVSYRCGRLAEARAALDTAIATGNQDALLFYHRGMILAAQHQDAAARADLQKALALNPYFHPFGPGIARATIAQIDASSGRRLS